MVGDGDHGPVEYKVQELQSCVTNLKSIPRDVIKNCFLDLSNACD